MDSIQTTTMSMLMILSFLLGAICTNMLHHLKKQKKLKQSQPQELQPLNSIPVPPLCINMIENNP